MTEDRYAARGVREGHPVPFCPQIGVFGFAQRSDVWYTIAMSPTVFKIKNYRFVFFSREEKRVHIHVSSPDGEAKFWIEPDVELVRKHGFSQHQITELERLVKEHSNEIRDAWNRHFRC